MIVLLGDLLLFSILLTTIYAHFNGGGQWLRDGLNLGNINYEEVIGKPHESLVIENSLNKDSMMIYKKYIYGLDNLNELDCNILEGKDDFGSSFMDRYNKVLSRLILSGYIFKKIENINLDFYQVFHSGYNAGKVLVGYIYIYKPGHAWQSYFQIDNGVTGYLNNQGWLILNSDNQILNNFPKYNSSLTNGFIIKDYITDCIPNNGFDNGKVEIDYSKIYKLVK